MRASSRHSRGRVRAGARARRPALRAGSLPVLGPRRRRETRCTPCGRSARTIAASQRWKRALRARPPRPCAPRPGLQAGPAREASESPQGLSLVHTRPQRRAMSLPAHTRPRLCQHHCGTRRQTPRAPQRGGRCPVGATCGAARSAATRGGEPGRARVPADSCSPGEPARPAGRAVEVRRRRRRTGEDAVRFAARSAPRTAVPQPPSWRGHRSEVGAQRRPPQ